MLDIGDAGYWMLDIPEHINKKGQNSKTSSTEHPGTSIQNSSSIQDQPNWAMGLYAMVKRIVSSLILIGLASYAPASSGIEEPAPQSSIIIEDNEFYENTLAGIRLSGSAAVTIKQCTIRSNGRAGININGRSRGGQGYLHVTITDCTLFQNARAGINVEEPVRISIEGSRIYANELAGLRLLTSGAEEGRVLQAKVSNSRIYANGEAGIRCMPAPENKNKQPATNGPDIDLTADGNQIHQNKRAGIRVENNTRLTAVGNRIHDNGTGIVSYASKVLPTLDIYRNQVSFNNGPGIHVVDGVTGPVGIRNNWIYNNGRSGISCGVWENAGNRRVNLEIVNNTIVSNGAADEGAGIRNDSDGRVIIKYNIIAYNYVTGIRTKGCEGHSYNLLFANGDMGNCCDDPYSAPYWTERAQFAGCPGRGEGDLITNPLFVDPDNYDFRLRKESPAINAGTQIDQDENETLLPQLSQRLDMGATGGPYATR